MPFIDSSKLDIDSFDWVGSSVIGDVDSNFGHTFCQNLDDSRLQVTRFFSLADGNGDGLPDFYVDETQLNFPDEIDGLVVRRRIL